MMGFGGRLPNGISDTGRLSNYNMGDMYSVQFSRGPTPRPSNFEENSPEGLVSSSRFGHYSGKSVPGSYPAPNPEISSAVPKTGKTHQSQLQQHVKKMGIHVIAERNISFITSKMKRGISNIHGFDVFPMKTQPSICVGGTSRAENSRDFNRRLLTQEPQLETEEEVIKMEANVSED
ncbi:auxin efflux carrier component 3-like [Henckelia pumila]|uniref:auxin efflux carrier component 3-like n=1 Tax=Henckelia pumila TaxID=405737 RepID=UPI003C6E1F1E